MQKLPEQLERVETGVVQFGNDWPGIFIRGDHSAYFAMLLRTHLEGGVDDASDIIAGMQLKGLVELLESCEVLDSVSK